MNGFICLQNFQNVIDATSSLVEVNVEKVGHIREHRHYIILN